MLNKKIVIVFDNIENYDRMVEALNNFIEKTNARAFRGLATDQKYKLKEIVSKQVKNYKVIHFIEKL